MKKPIMENLFLLEEQRQEELKPKRKEKTDTKEEDIIIYCYDREASNEQGHHEP